MGRLFNPTRYAIRHVYSRIARHEAQKLGAVVAEGVLCVDPGVELAPFARWIH